MVQKHQLEDPIANFFVQLSFRQMEPIPIIISLLPSSSLSLCGRNHKNKTTLDLSSDWTITIWILDLISDLVVACSVVGATLVVSASVVGTTDVVSAIVVGAMDVVSASVVGAPEVVTASVVSGALLEVCEVFIHVKDCQTNKKASFKSLSSSKKVNTTKAMHKTTEYTESSARYDGLLLSKEVKKCSKHIKQHPSNGPGNYR